MKTAQQFFCVAVLAAAPVAVIAQQRDRPISLKAVGSFYVGGQRTEIKHSGEVVRV